MASGSNGDVRAGFAAAPMTARQVVAIGICVALNALDGFDVLSISFASPGIVHEWGIDRAALGIVLSMELIGMMAGSVLLGQLADRIGRKAVTIACLVLMAAGMLATMRAHSIDVLAATRFVTGIGIGGMLATTNAMAAEFASDKWRATAVAVMAAGYPVGAIVGGSIASHLLATGGWRQVFALGAGMTAVFLPLVPLLLPEPVAWLLHRRPAEALARVNRSLATLGHAPIAQLPPIESETRAGFAELFAPGVVAVTLLLTLAYFSHAMTFYFLLKWLPKIVTDMGFAPSAAGGVLVWTNVGGLIGGLSFGAAARRFDPLKLGIAAMVASCVMIALFGQVSADLHRLAIAAGAAGFCTNAGMVSLYAAIAARFPARMRGGATGLVIGLGRGGAALGPIIAGFLFQAKFGLGVVAVAMACGSLIGAAAMLALPKRRDQDMTDLQSAQ